MRVRRNRLPIVDPSAGSGGSLPVRPSSGKRFRTG
jgi:hypothetical protein